MMHKFNVRITCDENGNIQNYILTLKDSSKTYHSINYSNTNSNVLVSMIIDVNTYSKIEFNYNKGVSATTNITISKGASNYALNMSVNVETLNNFVINDAIKNAIAGGQILFDSDVAVSKKYSGVYKYSGSCYYLACYDTDANIYVVFKQTHYGQYEYFDITTDPNNYDACVVTTNINDKTFTLVSHSVMEELENTLTTKYAGKFTYTGSYDLGGAIIYDDELQVYVVFIETSNGYVFEGYEFELPPELVDTVPISKINLTTKTITD